MKHVHRGPGVIAQSVVVVPTDAVSIVTGVPRVDVEARGHRRLEATHHTSHADTVIGLLHVDRPWIRSVE